MQEIYVVLTTRDTRYGMQFEAEAAYIHESDAQRHADHLREFTSYESVTVEYLRVRDSFE